VSGDEQNDEKVEEAAAHAALSVEHRRQMQRDSVKAEAAEGAEADALEHGASEHREAAEAHEEAAGQAAREADQESES
jgi:hypothetical protein